MHNATKGISLIIPILQDYLQSEDHLWRGTNNGDDVSQYQGRKAIQAGAALIIAGMELDSQKFTLERQEAIDLFYNTLRHIDNDPVDPGHGTDGFNLRTFLNLWKMDIGMPQKQA